MSKNIQWIYQPKQIKKASKFIFKKNMFLSMTLEEIELSIHDMIRRGIKDIDRGVDNYHMSTGGWTILLSLDGNHGCIEVLVDPAVSKDHNYEDYNTKKNRNRNEKSCGEGC